MVIKIFKTPEEKLNIPFILISIATTLANSKLAKGPNIAMIAISRFGFFRLYGFTGTGLAQPKTIGLPPVIFANIIIVKGTKIVPTKSMCLNGFKLKRPYCSAVLSPSILAA
jgi:hypothetical protein